MMMSFGEPQKANWLMLKTFLNNSNPLLEAKKQISLQRQWLRAQFKKLDSRRKA